MVELVLTELRVKQEEHYQAGRDCRGANTEKELKEAKNEEDRYAKAAEIDEKLRKCQKPLDLRSEEKTSIDPFYLKDVHPWWFRPRQ